MEEIKSFIKKLKDQRTSDRKRQSFLVEHKFSREAKFFEERIAIVDEIVMQLEMVVDGQMKGNEANFRFDN